MPVTTTVAATTPEVIATTPVPTTTEETTTEEIIATTPVVTTTTEEIIATTPVVATTTEEVIATTPVAAEPEPNPEMTVIVIWKETQTGQDLVLKGGKASCPVDSTDPACEIDISLRDVDASKWPEYSAWKVGDDKLGWTPSPQQTGTKDDEWNTPAYGTPLRWTTNDGWNSLYDNFNNYGAHEWMVVLDMDCSQTADDDGWFKFTVGQVEGGQLQYWEDPAKVQQGECVGNGETAPYEPGVHYAKCGAFNKFAFNYPSCEIDEAHWSLNEF